MESHGNPSDDTAERKSATGAATVDTTHAPVKADVVVTTNIRNDQTTGGSHGQMQADLRVHNPDGTTSVLRLVGELKDTLEQHAITTYSFNGDTRANGCSGSPDAFTSTLSVNDERGTSSLSVTFGDSSSKPSSTSGSPAGGDGSGKGSSDTTPGVPGLPAAQLPLASDQRQTGSRCVDGTPPPGEAPSKAACGV
jgi:hypothetical protein